MQKNKIKISIYNSPFKSYGVNGSYAIVVDDGNGSRYELHFAERPAKVLYMFALRHPEGFQRRLLARDNYAELLDICRQIYGTGIALRTSKRLASNFDRFVSQGMAALRRGIAASTTDNVVLAKGLSLVDPRSTGGLVYIPFLKEGVALSEIGKSKKVII